MSHWKADVFYMHAALMISLQSAVRPTLDGCATPGDTVAKQLYIQEVFSVLCQIAAWW